MRPESRCAEFSFRASRRFRAAVALLHGLAALTIVVGPSPVWLFATLPLLAMSGWLNWRSARSPVQLRCHGDDWFLLDVADGSSSGSSSGFPDKPAAEPEAPEALVWLSSTRIGPHLTLLHAKSAARRYFWPVASDSLPADEFRRLRVWVGLANRCD